jgi:phage gpG-like protein
MASQNSLSLFLRALQKDLKGLERQVTKDVIEVEVENFVVKNFEDQAFAGRAWQGRVQGDSAKNRSLLVQTGRLRRDVTKAKTRGNVVEISSRLPYAAIHNEGGDIDQIVTPKQRAFFFYKHKKTGDVRWKHMALAKSLHIKIPERRFIGESLYLDARIRKKIDAYMNHLMS